jgi:hypothetical protein
VTLGSWLIGQDIAAEELSEATIGYSVLAHGELFKRLFQRPYFYVQLVPDVAGAEMAGTLKNIVALAAGFVDGLGLGPNTKVREQKGRGSCEERKGRSFSEERKGRGCFGLGRQDRTTQDNGKGCFVRSVGSVSLFLLPS